MHSGLSNPSLFNPPAQMAPAINMFRDLVLKDLATLPPKKIYNHSFSKAGLKSLCERQDLVIRPMDKGKAVG